MWLPLSRWGEELWLSLGSLQGIQTSLHLVRWNTSLNLRHCREIRASFESGSLAVHSTWDRKHSVPLTYLLLRENSSWGAGGKLVQIFNQRQGISSHLGTIWDACSFPRVAVLILIFISTWDGCLRESRSIPQGSQATCTVLWNTGYLWSKWGGNALHLVLISATPIYFAFLSWHQSSSRLVTVFLGTLWCSIKKIVATYVFN